MTEQGSPSPGVSPPRPESLVFTLKAKTGEILKFESVEETGHRRELSKSEISDLMKQAGGPGVEALLERVFEAGIACLLDGRDGKDDESETEDERGVRRILLDSLMEGSGAARAMRRDVLREAIVQTLIHEAAGSQNGEKPVP